MEITKYRGKEFVEKNIGDYEVVINGKREKVKGYAVVVPIFEGGVACCSYDLTVQGDYTAATHVVVDKTVSHVVVANQLDDGYTELLCVSALLKHMIDNAEITVAQALGVRG